MEQNLNEKYHPELGGKSQDTCPTSGDLKLKLSKKGKKVQFQDRYNVSISNSGKSSSATSRHQISSGFASLRKSEQQATAHFSVLNQNSQDAQDNSISSTVESPYTSTIKHNIPEVLDCRIAEKIKSELEQKLGAIESEFFKVKNTQQREHVAEALCLATAKETNERLTAEPPHYQSVIKIKKKSKSNVLHVERIGDASIEQPKKKPKNKTKKLDIRKAPPEQRLSDDFNNGNTDIEYSGQDTATGNICHTGKQQDDDLAIDDYGKDDDDDDDGEDNEDDYNDYDSDDGKLSDAEEPIDEEDPDEIDDTDDPIKANNCSYCDGEHATAMCTLRQASKTISDAIDLDRWMERVNIKSVNTERQIKKEEDQENVEAGTENEESADDNESQLSNQQFASAEFDEQQCFAILSLPIHFELRTITIGTTASIATGIFARETLEMFTKLGPLVGVQIPEVDMPDDCSMQFVMETYDGTRSTYFSMEDKNKSNWFRYVRPAPTRDARNLIIVSTDTGVYFVTCKEIADGCELLYWSDDCNSAWGKKKISKMSK